ncbi:MAG: DUF1036 domain-containing protein [Bacteroidetes bacterium]|nr:DUF1036 domain-containing protein [Bacteroidota bacterium]
MSDNQKELYTFVQKFMKSMFRMLILCSFLFILAEGHPQITFKNNHDAQIYVAMCRYISSGGYWMTTGWFTIGKGGERLVFDKISASDTIGYWAMTTITEEKFEGKKNLLVNDDSKFTIKYADKPETAGTNPLYSWRKFILLRLPAGATKGAINFK